MKEHMCVLQSRVEFLTEQSGRSFWRRKELEALTWALGALEYYQREISELRDKQLNNPTQDSDRCESNEDTF